MPPDEKEPPEPSSAAPLTRRQMDILNFIAETQSVRGASPMLREIAAAFGVSVSTVRPCLRALARKGFLSMTRYARRGIRLTRGRGEWKVRRSWQGEFDRRIGSKLEGETDLGRIFGRVAGDLRTWLDVERADLYVADPQRRVLRGCSFYEMRPGEDAKREARDTAAGSAVERAFRLRRTFVEASGPARPGSWTAAVPVPGRERVLGVLRLEGRAAGKPGPELLARAGVAAAALAPALDRAAVHADLQRGIRLQAALVSLCRTINSTRELKPVLKAMYAIVAGLVEAPVFLIAIREGRMWWLLHERDEVDGTVIERIGPRPFRPDIGNAISVLDTMPYEIRHRTPEEIRKYEEKGPGFSGDGYHSAGFVQKRSCSLLFVPLKDSGRRIGSLSVQSYRYNAYRLRDAEDLILIGAYIGIAVRNALRVWRDRRPEARDRRRLRRMDRLETELRGMIAEPAGTELRPRLAAILGDLEALRRRPPD